jgi:hypothetical protein
MLHLYYKWRYERTARSGAFELPKARKGGHKETVDLGSYLSQLYGQRRGVKPYDLPRKRRKFMRILAVALGIALLAWITYESIIALAFL